MKKEVKIALVAIVALVMLFFGLNFLKGLDLFSSTEVYYVSFSNVSGVTKNCPVFADGVQVGSVSDIAYDYNHEKPTMLTVEVDKQLRIPKGSSAEVASDLMGNTQLNLLLSNNVREKVNPGETIKGAEGDGTMERLKAMVPTIESMGPKVDSILTALNILLKDPSIQATLHNAEYVTGNLKTSTDELNRLLAQLNSSVPGMITKANGVLDNTNTLTGNLARVDVDGTMTNVNQVISHVDATLADVQQTLNKLNSSEGTVGKLLNDPGLYDNLNSTMQNADSLVIDLKQHPKRYVHFSIW